MAKAIFIDEPGGSQNFKIRDFTPPPPGAGELRLRHRAIGLNFIDIYHRTGLYPVSMPAILGSEAAGVVEEVGDGVEGFAPGDRVASCSGGAYAEISNVAAAMAVKIPSSVSDVVAAAVLLKGLTAGMLVRQVFTLDKSHCCLIHAAAGGVGALLVHWAKHIGARVIAVVGSAEKASLVEKLGADHVLVRTDISSIADEVRKLTDGRGCDVVYDSVGAATFIDSLNALALRGHMVSFGNASGPPPAIAPSELAQRGSLTLTRPSLFHYATPDRFNAMAGDLFSLIADGVLNPLLGPQFKLEDISAAHDFLESGKSTGAIVLTP